MNRQQLKDIAIATFLRYYWYLLIVTCLVILLAGYFLFISLKFQEVRSVGLTLLRTRQQQLVERQFYRERLQRMVSEFQARVTEADRTFLAQALPDGPDVPGLIVMLSDLARETSVVIDSFSFSEEQAAAATAQPSGVDEFLRPQAETSPSASTPAQPPKSGVQSLLIRLALFGPLDYPGLQSFLEAVESSARLFNIESLRFSLGQEEGGPGATSGGRYDVTMRTFYLPSLANAR